MPPLAPTRSLPHVEGHGILIQEFPKSVNNFEWIEYLPFCDCGWFKTPPRGRYHTERGAIEAARLHLNEVRGEPVSTNPLDALGGM